MEGREASPSVAHRRTLCKRPKWGPQRDPIGYDAGKKTKGSKRNVIVDTIGLLLGIAVIPANIQDRDCAANLIRKTRQLFPWIAKIFADGGYAGAKLKAAGAEQPQLEMSNDDNDDGSTPCVAMCVQRTLSWFHTSIDGGLRCNPPCTRGHSGVTAAPNPACAIIIFAHQIHPSARLRQPNREERGRVGCRGGTTSAANHERAGRGHA